MRHIGQMTVVLFVAMFIPSLALANPPQSEVREVPKAPLVSSPAPVPAFKLADAVRREGERIALVSYVDRLQGGSTPEKWKCRTRWAVIGAAMGAVITVVAIRDGDDGFGPKPGTLVFLGALAGTAGGLLVSTEKC